ncbi:MAG TPA: prolyl oligopeptidase family serine peptidase [Pyrinomonadaceae bacterium]|nr:prolyl oligopeptidase family serine peptidase [Pyrinomonadaceae bacterium]
MKKIQLAFASFLLIVLTLSVSFSPLVRIASGHADDIPRLTYPETKRVDVVDDYFGTKVPDPYRWLEDDNAPEVAAWVEAENRVTFGYLDKIPYRAQLKDRLTKLLNYPKFSAPTRRGDWFFFTKNDGLQNQSVWYIQKGLDGAADMLLDPNKFSTDGTSRLGSFSLSQNGKYVGYGISEGGSDWNEIYVLDVATRKPLADHLEWVKFSGASWRGDEGFYYNRYPAAAAGKKMAGKNEYQKVFYHKIGTQQSADELVFEDNEHPGRFNGVSVTDDQRFEIRTQSDPTVGKKGNSLFFRDLSKGAKSYTPIMAEIGDDDYGVVDNLGDKFLIQTNHDAPNGKIVLWDPKNPQNWAEVIPEKPEPLEIANTVGGKLFVTYLKDVSTRAYIYSLAGKLENEVNMPGPGSAGGFGGRADDKFTFYTFTSFNYPPTIYKYDIATRKSSVFRTVDIPGFIPANYETRQVFYNSKDGTRVPMFITNKKGIKLDGNNPTVLYGYGGFNITTSPGFSALRIAMLEQGVVYASANIRGGGEYGEKWHEAGTKLKKQNVFDDFIAAAEYLIKERITSSSKLAIHGGSNGGLLVGACSNQRPDLFKAVIEQAGVMDMLRFHKFTIGGAWISDYGSSEQSEAQFKALYAISPIHNIKPGTKYPATLITTADHDDRVVPAHNFKYAAALQAAQAGDNPILIRIDTKSGHGASSTTKTLEQTTDLYSFIFENLGVNPKW